MLKNPCVHISVLTEHDNILRKLRKECTETSERLVIVPVIQLIYCLGNGTGTVTLGSRANKVSLCILGDCLPTTGDSALAPA